MYFFSWYTCQYLFVHRQIDSSLFFLCQVKFMTPIRHCSVNTELISK